MQASGIHPQRRTRFAGLSRLFFMACLYMRCGYVNISPMELTLQLKLLPTADQAMALHAVMTRFNEA